MILSFCKELIGFNRAHCHITETLTDWKIWMLLWEYAVTFLVYNVKLPFVTTDTRYNTQKTLYVETSETKNHYCNSRVTEII